LEAPIGAASSAVMAMPADSSWSVKYTEIWRRTLTLVLIVGRETSISRAYAFDFADGTLVA
jgi:hypothetical protein